MGVREGWSGLLKTLPPPFMHHLIYSLFKVGRTYQLPSLKHHHPWRIRYTVARTGMPRVARCFVLVGGEVFSVMSVCSYCSCMTFGEIFKPLSCGWVLVEVLESSQVLQGIYPVRVYLSDVCCRVIVVCVWTACEKNTVISKNLM